MHCPYCGHTDSKVIDSRDVENGVRRRRECLDCGTRFTTYERIETVSLAVIKKDGRREDFDRAKLTAGIRKACEKRPLPIGALEKVVDDIEADLLRLGKAEVPSANIGELVMERLRALDHVAYIRYASVYRDFADIEAFQQELEHLAQAPSRPWLSALAAQPSLLPREELEGLKKGQPHRRGRKKQAG